jgi:hypothetical protein
MSKGSGIGQKRMGTALNKGMDKCEAGSHSKQCGRPQKVSKGKKWINEKRNRKFSP